MAKPILIPDSPAHNNQSGPPSGPAAAPAAGLARADKALTVAALSRAIGRRLAALRRERGLSQEELGWRAGHHRTRVSQIERGVGNPTLAILVHFAIALDVPLSTLCGGDGG